MHLEQVTKEAMKLNLEERAELAQQLLASLDDAPASEIEKLWLEEAERRLREFREGKTKGIPTEEVFRKAVAELS
jgi:putative addiction module component (TIGR02574 family)